MRQRVPFSQPIVGVSSVKMPHCLNVSSANIRRVSLDSTLVLIPRVHFGRSFMQWCQHRCRGLLLRL
jgi:hypothetical protein